LKTFEQPKQVKARHILFRVDEEAPKEKEEEARKKAETVLEKARKGDDFAELAKEYSEGPSGSRGGDLGYFAEGKMVKPFEEAAFALKNGEISDLVQTKFGLHIIKVEDVKEAGTQPLDEVRDQIKESLMKMATGELAHERGLSLMDQLPFDIDLTVYAKQQGIEPKLSGLFSMSEPVPGITGSERAVRSIFSLGKNETSELVELGDKFYIFQVAERKASYLPDMKEVEAKVRAD
jgi:peptidyl-prolyl cis-trans isomerase D